MALRIGYAVFLSCCFCQSHTSAAKCETHCWQETPAKLALKDQWESTFL